MEGRGRGGRGREGSLLPECIGAWREIEKKLKDMPVSSMYRKKGAERLLRSTQMPISLVDYKTPVECSTLLTN